MEWSDQMLKDLVQVKACVRCKGLFETTGEREVCSRCYELIEKQFKVVRRFVREHEMAGIEEVSEKCGIAIKQILEWIREEKLSFSKESKVGIPCLACGISIPIGKYCVSCQTKLSKNLHSVYVKKEEDIKQPTLVSNGSRMHFLGHTR
jgi:hypothetical protein